MEFKIGRFDDVSLETYHRMPGYSKSALDLINQSMAHYLEARENPAEPTPALTLGAAFHCRVLTPDLYQAQYVVAPNVDRRTKDGKAAWEEFTAVSAGKTIISCNEAAQVEKMAQSVLSHPVASKMLTDGDAEHSFFWIDPKTGLKCKCRPDYYRRDGIVLDLKSCESASFNEFQRSVATHRYYVQGAFFMDGIHATIKELPHSFTLIAVEKKAPYAVAIYTLDDAAIDVGRSAYRENLLRAAEWEKTGGWAGYPCMIQEMFLPAWAA